MAPQVYEEEHELLIRDPRAWHTASWPSFIPSTDNLQWTDLPGTQEWHGHSSAATQRAEGPWAHVRACNLAGGSVEATAVAFLRPESMSKNVNL